MSNKNDADLILTNQNNTLWLGNYKSALDYNFLKKNKISIIINCTPDIPFIYTMLDTDNNDFVNFESIRIPIHDNSSDKENQILLANLKDTIDFIHFKFFKQHKNILIHCAAGVSRSASVMAAFIFDTVKKDKNKYDKNLNDSQIMKNVISYIVKKRPRAFFYGSKLNFKKALDTYFNIDVNLY
jgi:protein tyrosine phosphatase